MIVGVRAHTGIEASLKQWQSTIDYLSQRIDGHTFRLAPYDKLEELSAAAHRGAFDYVITNPSSYVEMEINSGASRMLTLINKRQGDPYTQFGSVIFTRSERTEIKSFDDLRGRTLMAVSELAFGGWQVAWGELLKNGIDPKKHLKRLVFAGGNQQDVVYAVRDGKVDVGVVRTDMLERMAENGDIDITGFRPIGQHDDEEFPFLRSTDLFPEWALAKFPRAPIDLSRKVALGLLDMPADSAAAIAGKYVGWSVPLNYQPVHDLLQTLKVGPYTDYGKVTLRDT
ncbi:MAG: phosphate/phosphite/phosphonate ABC transporter substrate-binding protein, partial [Alphaproteobacteria bacterium]